jgi:hypothetical protein
LFKKISELSVMKILLISAVFSLAFNAIFLFQYAINDGSFGENNSSSEYPLMITRGYALQVFLFIRCILNYFFFAFLITFFEIVIVIKLHRELTGLKRRSAVVSYSNATNEIKISKIEEAVHKIEHKAMALILLNALVYFVLRFPELFTALLYTQLLFEGNYLYTYFCGFLNICIHLPEFTNFFFILTFSTNYFM